jgi:thiol-disulfide isomerase/thioredoxin
MKIRAVHKEYNFPYLMGGGDYEAVSLAYGPVVTPHVCIFDEARKLRYVGRIDDAEREQYVTKKDTRLALDALLKGDEPPTAKTKVVGCSTKWSDKRSGVAKFWNRYNAEPVDVELVDAAGLKALRANNPAGGEDAKFRLVNFWATWCGPCVTEFPDLMEINRMYRGRDFEMVTVAANYPDEKDQVLKFLKKEKAATRNLLYGSTKKYDLMEAFDPDWDGGMPYTVLIDPKGKVVYRQNGVVDPLELKREIVKVLNAHKPW